MPSPLKFFRRAARPEDASAMLRLHRDAVRAVDPPEHDAEVLAQIAPDVVPAARQHWLAQRLRRGTEETVVAFGGDEAAMAGFASVLPRRRRLQAIYVAPAFQRRGIGRLLLEAAEAMAAADGTQVLFVQSSPSAVGFFAAHGFVEVGRGRSPLGGGLGVPTVDMEKRFDSVPRMPVGGEKSRQRTVAG